MWAHHLSGSSSAELPLKQVNATAWTRSINGAELILQMDSHKLRGDVGENARMRRAGACEHVVYVQLWLRHLIIH